MKTMITLGIGLLLFFPLTSCDAQTTLSYKNGAKAINVAFNKSSDSTITFTRAADSAIIINYLNSLFAGQNIKSIYEAWYDGVDPANKYLVFRCINSHGASYLIALSVKTAPDPIILEPGGGESHSCAGVNCSCCRFLKQKGQIVGCQCNCVVGHPLCGLNCSGRCDHNVTTNN